MEAEANLAGYGVDRCRGAEDPGKMLPGACLEQCGQARPMNALEHRLTSCVVNFNSMVVSNKSGALVQVRIILLISISGFCFS